MEKIKKLLSAAKRSVKSVALNYKEFLGIYAAVLIVQLLLGTWALSAFTNFSANDTLFDDEFRYDILIEGIGVEPEKTLETLEGVFRHELSGESTKKDPLVTSFGRFGNKLGVNIKAGEADTFIEEYLAKYAKQTYNKDAEITYEITPRYTYYSEIRGGTVTSSIILCVVIFAIGALILSVMYSVRTNHYKFQYGIYMTFGADKKMLGRIALGELVTINTLLLIPSFIISYLLVLTVYISSGVSVVVSLPQILLYIVLSYGIVLIASASSLGELFLKPPVALITTADNSNFVSSPRRSFHLFGKNIPKHYEFATAWRFRKYLIRLVSGAVAFSVIFIVGVYTANILITDQSASNEEFIITYLPSTSVESQRKEANLNAEEIVEALSKTKYVESARLEQSRDMRQRSDHLLLQTGADAYASGYTVTSRNELSGYTKATNYCRYVCIDELSLKIYEKLYDVEYLDGFDAESLPEKNMIIISEGLYGKSCFDFNPGDKVAVADMTKGNSDLHLVSDRLDNLKQQIDNFEYDYTEYTVGAVIHDREATESIIVGLTPKAYEALTGDKRAITEINVFVESGIGVSEISAVRASVAKIMAGYSNWNMKSTDASVFAIVDDRINLPGLIYLMSALVLVITPVIWIFSQVMFFKKRELEFRTLIHIGATMKDIRGIHLVSGLVLFVIGFLFNYVISRVSCYVIFEIFTSFLPGLGILGMNVSFDSFVPWYIILLYAVASALFGFMSSMIPYMLFKKKIDREEREADKMKTDLQ